MKLLKVFILSIMAAGCYDTATRSEPVMFDAPIAKVVYIVAGQSNAVLCDWSYFENLTNSEVVNIAVSGSSIEQLIHDYDSSTVSNSNAKAILLVHGETDSIEKTNTTDYINSVESYRVQISNDVGVNLPLIISSVGYQIGGVNDDFDAIRNAVNHESYINNNWLIGYDDAKYFIEWGLLFDEVHFNQTGCQLMMDGLAGWGL